MWEVLLVVVWGWFCFPTVVRFINTIKGYNKIKMIHSYGIASVKLIDVQQKKEDYLKAILFALVALGLVFYCIYVNMRIKSISFGIVFCFMIINQILGIIQLLIIKKYGEFAYLTKSFFVSIYGEFSQKDCKFSVEKNLQEKESMYLTVLKGKKEQLYRFEVIEKPEEVVQMIEEFYQSV